MAIVAGDLKFYMSGGTSNSDPDLCLGGAVSSTEITDNTLNNMFDDVTGDEHAAGDTEYRAFFFKNTNATDTAYNAKVWIETNTPASDDTINIGVEPSLGSPIQTIGSEDEAPTGFAFSSAAGQSNAITIGDMDAGEMVGIWVKRIVSVGTTPQSANSAVIRVYVDTV